MKKLLNYFSLNELALWIASIFFIVSSYLIFDRGNSMAFVASLIGVTAIIFAAKANPFGQFLMIIFCVMYGIISYSYAYYGEMLTYVLMTGPMAVFSFISWLKNPFKGNVAEVEINSIEKKEFVVIFVVAIIVTAIFYPILNYFHTANIIPSTISVTTSCIAVYLTFRRSEFYSLAYVANDIVLIILWTMASKSDTSYISVLVCFFVFLINDIYAYISWRKIRKRQMRESLS